MSMEPKFTVIIPTRERADVLRYTLKTVLKQDYDNLSVIVSDNFSQDHTREVVEMENDPRLTYLNTGSRLSMSKNWEFALSHCSGGWITILGDDDGLLPGSIREASEIMSEYKVMALRSEIGSYFWPQATGNNFGKLSFCPNGTKTEMRRTSEWLRRALLGYSPCSQLPMLYTGGFVHFDLVQKARAPSGQFYCSMIPDIYSAIAFSRVENNYLYTDRLLAVGGVSKFSNGASSNLPQSQNNKSSTPFDVFLNEPNIPFHKDAPSMENGGHLRNNQVIMLESFLQSNHLKKNKEFDLSIEEHISLIIKNSKPKFRDEALFLAEKLSINHGLKLKKTGIRREDIIRHFYKFLFRTHKRHSTVSIDGTPSLPIANILDACVLASERRNAESHTSD